MSEYTREQAEDAKEIVKDFCEHYDICLHGKSYENFINHKFPKLEVGKWYKSNAKQWSKVLIYIIDITDSWIHFFGNDTGDSHTWIEEGQLTRKTSNLFKFSPATDEEVVEMLTKEAKKRYKTGDTIISTYNGELYELDIVFSYHLKKTDKGVFSYGYEVMRHGKWAEVVKEETYSIGDRFEIDGHMLVLACTMEKHVALICIDTGRRVEQAVRVEQVEKVTQKEFRSIFPTEELFNRVTKIK